MSDEQATGQPTEAELQAAYEAEVKKITVEQVLLENVVSLVNLGMRRTGLSPGTEDERDQEQVRLSIDAIRALLPLVEQVAPEHGRPIRDALSQLQLAFVKIGGSPAAADGESGSGGDPGASGGGGAPGGGGAAGGGGDGGRDPAPQQPPGPATPGDAGPAQRSGRLWVPGQ
jgi:uncharacterized membrane protein YgcG